MNNSHTQEATEDLRIIQQKGLEKASGLIVPDFTKKAFCNALPKIKELATTQPRDFTYTLQRICQQYGMKVVFSSNHNLGQNGCSFWDGNTPIIHMTDKGKRNDIFWFHFFKYLGFVMLEPKGRTFFDEDKDEKVIKFARNWIFTNREIEESEIFIYCEDIKKHLISQSMMIKLAKELNTHPAMVIGGLMHQQILPYSFGNSNLFVRVEFP